MLAKMLEKAAHLIGPAKTAWKFAMWTWFVGGVVVFVAAPTVLKWTVISPRALFLLVLAGLAAGGVSLLLDVWSLVRRRAEHEALEAVVAGILMDVPTGESREARGNGQATTA